MGTKQFQKRGIVFLIVFTLFSSIVVATTISNESHEDVREWIHNNYPIFDEEGIELELRDSFHYGGQFIYPNKIIIHIGDLEIGSDLLKQRIEHELMHLWFSKETEICGLFDYDCEHFYIDLIERGYLYRIAQ